MTITEELKRVIIDSGETHYGIGKGAGIDTRLLDRFVSGERPYLRSDTIDRLCEYFGLELRQKKGRSAAKQSAKKRAAAGNQSATKKTSSAKKNTKRSAKM